MDIKCGMCIYSRILLSHKKEWSPAIGNDMDEVREYNENQNKSVRKRQIPYDFTHMWHLRNKTVEHRGIKKRERETNQETDT